MQRAHALTFLTAALALQPAACASSTGTETGTGTGASTSSSVGTGGMASGTGGATSTSGTTSNSGTAGSGGAPPAPAPFGCVTDVSAGHHQFDCGDSLGIAYDVEIPTACAAGGCGLVLDIPGYTSNADEEDMGTGARALGQQYGYVVVQPTAPAGTWIQDIDNPKVMAFVSDSVHALVIDPKRVHAMGFSQGGALVWGLICKYSDILASASSLAAASPWLGNYQGCDLVAPDVPSKAIPVLQVHGHNDAVLSFSVYAEEQLQAAKDFWGWSDGDGTVFQSGTGYQATRYTNPDGISYEFWEHDYAAENGLGGHCFPGGGPVGFVSNDYGCAPPTGFVYGQVAMQFFVAHPQK